MSRIAPTEPLRQKQPRQKDRKYLLWIKNLPCIICALRGRLNSPCDAAHLRYGDPDQGKRPTGMQEKPDDKWCLPLCDQHHRNGQEAQHNHAEREWWANMNIDPVRLCGLLYHNKHDTNYATQIIRQTVSDARKKNNQGDHRGKSDVTKSQ